MTLALNQRMKGHCEDKQSYQIWRSPFEIIGQLLMKFFRWKEDPIAFVIRKQNSRRGFGNLVPRTPPLASGLFPPQPRSHQRGPENDVELVGRSLCNNSTLYSFLSIKFSHFIRSYFMRMLRLKFPTFLRKTPRWKRPFFKRNWPISAVSIFDIFSHRAVEVRWLFS